MAKVWFIGTGSPARNGNVIEPLVNGEVAWKDVLATILTAQESIHLAYWMMHLDHELDRPAALTFKDPVDRQANTLHDILLKQADRGVRVRILLWVLASMTPAVTANEIARWVLMPSLAPASMAALLDFRVLKYALQGKFQLLLEPHPTVSIGSWHQKTIVVDGRVAYVGGMNTRENDWDESAHRVFEYRRTPHATTGSQRSTLSAKREQPKFAPRHDFATHIEGPLVMDVQNNFVQRWNQAIDDKRLFSAGLVKLAMRSSQPTASGKKRGQIVRTVPAYPAVPMGEKGCMELYQRAIRNAEKYIYIEDQYFRSGIMAQELASAVRKNPKLIVLVVTQPDQFADIEWAEIGIGTLTTYWTHDAFVTIQKALPSFCLFELIMNDVDASGNQVYVRANTHAKMMIVDDEWYTIGSCNLNDRGFLFEGEINVGVADAEDAFKLRMQLFSAHLQTPCPAKIEDAAKLWYDHAAKNVTAMKAKTKPVSHVFSFAQSGPVLPIAPRTWF